MNIKKFLLLTAAAIIGLGPIKAADDYKNDPEYLALRDSLHHGFNSGDSARFFPALHNLEEYLLKKDDMHAYYTQRCNEIVFLMNRQHIYEAYVLARKLSTELREKGLEKEMYMAYNMLGHINRYCGNNETAKENFYKVLELMEKYGYYESMPPIYMNIVNVELGDDAQKTYELLDKAKEVAEKYSPERVFDIETRKTITYFNDGNIPLFLEGYKKYKEGEKEGKTSVHGRNIEIYYQAAIGNIDKAVELAREYIGDSDGADIITMIYEKAERWKDAYEWLRKYYTQKDSVTNVVLINSMQGLREQLTLYELERREARTQMIALGVGILLLLMLVGALMYIVHSRKRHMKQLESAYQHALESDRMKTAFIQNVSHEIRTPLNIISGFAQLITDPDMAPDAKERQHMSQMMQKNTHQITKLIDEVLELSLSESADGATKEDNININGLLNGMISNHHGLVNEGVSMKLESEVSDDYCIISNNTLLRRAIEALIDNSIKYTKEGTIILRAQATDKQLSIAVEDTGSGIPKEEAEHIFERFFKIDSFKEGLGLGLPLCRTLIRRLDGDVHLDTSYSQGAKFVITLNIND